MRKKNKSHKSKIIIFIMIIFVVCGVGIGIYESKPTVCIDAGHGGNDAGASNDERYEKDDTLDIVLAVKEILEDQNVRVILTRNDDTYVSLENRCKIANLLCADLFVSVHRNSGTTGNGVEVWIETDADEVSQKLANDIMTNLENTEIQSSRGVKEGTMENDGSDYYVNKYTNMPSCLIELGFISNKKDNQLLDENLEEYAKAIANGILQNLE